MNNFVLIFYLTFGFFILTFVSRLTNTYSVMKSNPSFSSPSAFRFCLMAFLEQKGCLSAFKRNLGERFSLGRFCSVVYRRSRLDPVYFSSAISGAFFWNSTPEGFDFWLDVDGSWLNYLHSIRF